MVLRLAALGSTQWHDSLRLPSRCRNPDGLIELPTGPDDPDPGRRAREEYAVISLVIPVYNEKDSLTPLYDEIAQAAARNALDLEVIFVDDGSGDGSWKIITDLASRHPEVHGIRFRRNFGKAAALSAGFRAARGDTVLTLDADLQDDPAEIPRFLQALAEGKDVISGWKRRRLDPWHKVWPSRVFNRMVSWLTGVRLHDHNCGMKCYRAEVFREVRLYGELHRFIPVLAAARGFRVGEIEINHRPRRFGRSKYGVRRFIKGFLDLMTVKFLTGFGQRPQHALGTIGLLSFLAGALGMIYLGITWVVRLWDKTLEPLHNRPLLIYAVAALLLGAQMMSIGLIAEMITAFQGRDEENYSIAEQTGPAPPPLVRGPWSAPSEDPLRAGTGPGQHTHQRDVPPTQSAVPPADPPANDRV
jgi:glycosyltransferase involved in cell wall biosynthesis